MLVAPVGNIHQLHRLVAQQGHLGFGDPEGRAENVPQRAGQHPTLTVGLGATQKTLCEV